MRKLALTICIISFLLIVVGAIWSLVYNWTHIDQTELRQLINNPYPTIMAIVGVAGLVAAKELN